VRRKDYECHFSHFICSYPAYDFLIEYEESEKSADLRAVLGSIYRCKHSSDKELKRYIRCVGELTEEEVEKFLSLYKKSI